MVLAFFMWGDISGKGCFPLSLKKNITRNEAVMANEDSLAIHSSIVDREPKIQQSSCRTSLEIEISSMAEPTIQQSAYCLKRRSLECKKQIYIQHLLTHSGF